VGQVGIAANLAIAQPIPIAQTRNAQSAFFVTAILQKNLLEMCSTIVPVRFQLPASIGDGADGFFGRVRRRYRSAIP
jgi:hypothetical protein